MREALVIGRFQIAGNQHVNLFEKIKNYGLDKGLKRINVGIGVADKIDGRNPFTGTECYNMIKPVADAVGKFLNIPVRYRLIPDIHDPDNYAAFVSEIFNFSFDDEVVLFSGNKYTIDCFKFVNGFILETVKEDYGIHSTMLRKMVLENKDISDYVPLHVNSYIKKNNLNKRLQKIVYENPVPTVDVVVEYNGKIVVIERNVKPEGYALPGGHVDYGESVQNAASREIKEEVGLDIKIKGLLGEFSSPDRDERGHKISIVFVAEGFGEIKAGSDAKDVKLFDVENVPKLQFDHDEIFEAYKLWKLKQKK